MLHMPERVMRIELRFERGPNCSSCVAINSGSSGQYHKPGQKDLSQRER